MLTDPIADMLTRIRNANVAMHDEVKHAFVQAEGRTGEDPRAGGLHQRVHAWLRPPRVRAMCSPSR